MKKNIQSSKIRFFQLCFFVFFVLSISLQPFFVNGQVSSYTFSQTTVVYSPITGGTVLATATGTSGAASLDDIVYNLPSGTIPFTFNFNYTGYTGFNLSTNGFITFGTTAPAGSGTTTGFSPLSATTAYSGAISALGRNLNAYYFAGTPAQTGEIRYQTLGTSPSRVFVIQFSNFKSFNTSGSTFGPVINLQIRLSETTNVIDLIYNLSGTFASTTAQVGLRGASNAFPIDINNRSVAAGVNTWATSAAGTANNSTCEFSSSLLPAAGLTYRFTPNNCPAPVAVSATNITQTTAQLVWTSVGGSGTYRVEYGLSGFSQGSGTVLNGVASGVAISGLTPATAYQFYVRQVCGGGVNSATVGPISFSTATAGEDCPTAQLLNIAGSLATCSFSTVNSGVSANGPNAICSDVNGNTPNDDRWYRFVAPSGTNKLVITTTAGTVNDWVMEVWNGCPNSGGTVMKCADDVNASMPEITLCQNEYTAGQTYFIRLWTYSITAAGTANLCVYQTTECPIPPVNDECLTATPLTVFPFGGCPGGAITQSTLYATPTTDGATCDAGTKRDVWFVFNTGNYSAINMTINPVTATTLKAQLLFECGGFELYCYSPANGTYQFTNLNPQADYVIRVWSDTLTAGTFSICLSGNCIAPTATLGASQSICAGQTASVPVSFTGAPPFTFVYRNNSTGQNTTITTASNPYQLLLNPTATTNYSLVSVSDVTGCPGSVNSNVTISVSSVPNVLLAPFIPVCANAGFQALSGGSPAGGVYSGVGVTNNQFNPSVGTQTITYTVGGNCGGSASQVFTVNPLPAVVLNSLGSHCTTVTPFALSGGTPAGGTYSGPGVSANIFNPLTAGVGNHIINYSYTSVSGCTNADTAIIRVINCGCTNPPTANAGPDKSSCGSSPVSVSASIGGAATTLSWSGGTGSYSPSATAANISYTPSSQEIIAGFARLILTTNDPDGAGPCIAAVDTVLITILPGPVTAPLSGSTSVCRGQTGISYSVTAQPGYTYNWTVPAGVSIASGQGTSVISTNFSANAVSGYVRVSASNSCGTTIDSLQVTVGSAPSAPVVTGSTGVCPGQSSVTYFTALQSGASYSWTVPAGVIITSGQGSSSIATSWSSSAVPGNVSVAVTNNCGTSNAVLSVNLNNIPVPPVVSGQALVCAASPGLIYTTTSQPGVTFNWTVPAGVSIVSGQNSNTITTNWSTSAVSGDVIVSATNICGTVTSSYAVSVTPGNILPGPVSGPTSVCRPSTGVVYSVNNQSGVYYDWDVPAGVIITSGQGTASITTSFTANASSGTIRVSASNSCDTTIVSMTVNALNAPATPSITGTSSVCRGQTAITYSTPAQAGSTYLWTVPSGAIITSGSGSASIVTTWTASAVAGNVGVTMTNSCGSANATFPVNVSSVPSTPVVSGQSSVCSGAQGLIYTTTAQQGTTFIWTVPSGVVITSGQGINSMSTDWSTSAVSGNISVAATNGCGTAIANYTVAVNAGPGNPGAVTGPASVCRPASGLTYSVNNQAGVTYNWTVPAGVTITSGQGSASINTTWSSSAANGNITVTLSNSCGTSSSFIPVITSNPPAIPVVTGQPSLCQGNTGISYTTTLQAGTTYIWTVPAGASITSGQGINSITTDWSASATSGNISVSATNSCGTASTTFPVTVYSAPANIVLLTGPSSVCRQSTGVVFTVNNQLSVSFSWQVPSGVTITSGQGTNSITTSWSSSASSGNISVSANNTCGNNSASFPVTVTTGSVNLSPVSGPASLCRPSTGVVYSVNNQLGVFYNWTVPAGVTITSGQGSHSITTNWGASALSGSISVSATNGCDTSTATQAVAIATGTVNLGILNGPSSICAPGSGLSFSVNNQVGVNYNWVVPGGVSIINGQGSNSITTNWGAAASSGNVSVTATDVCGTASATIAVSVISGTVNPGTITGISPVCRLTTGLVYSVSNQNGVSFNWTVPAGVTITSGQGSSAITTSWGGASLSGNVTVSATNTCGTASSSIPVSVTTGTPVLGAVTGLSTVCVPTSGVSYSVISQSGVAYNWVVPAGVTITSGQGGSVVTTAWGASASSGNISVTAANVCGTSSASFPVATSNITVNPGFITGPAVLCRPATGLIYSVNNQSGVAYNWVVPAGVTITSGQGSSSITTSWSASSSTSSISVTGTTPCDTVSVSRTVTVITGVPAIPGTITGPNGVCPGDSGIYRIARVSTADYYVWIPRPGMTINGSSLPVTTQDTSVKVVFLSNYNTDTLKVQSGNCFGLSTGARTLLITRSTNTTGVPAPISGRNRGLCGGGAYLFSIPSAIPGAVSYTWRITAAGALINGQPSPVTVPANTFSVTVTLPNSWTGLTGLYVKSNNACGSSSERMMTLTAAPAIPGTINGPLTVCTGSAKVGYSIAPVAGASAYNWTFPNTIALSGGQGTPNIRLNFSQAAGVRTLRVSAYNVCGTGSARSLNVNAVNCLASSKTDYENSINSVKLFPNPATSSCSLVFDADYSQKPTIIIRDLSGRELSVSRMSAVPGNNRYLIDLQQFAAGIYVLELKTSDYSNVLRLVVE